MFGSPNKNQYFCELKIQIIRIMGSQISLLPTILESTRTVFTVQSLMMLTGCADSGRLTKSLHYYASEGKIRNPRKGIYTKQQYDVQEMACCMFWPSYISLDYVLQRAGVVFQWNDTITCVSYLSRLVEVDGRQYQYRKISPEHWIGLEGIEQQDNVAIATPEKAFLDMVYLSAGNCSFDNLRPLSVKQVCGLLPLYHSKKLNERVTQLLR